MTTPIAAGPLDRRAGHQVTDQMVEAFLAFSDKTTHLHHPDVPYYGTVNGDSEESWRRRVVKAALTAALMPNGKVRGASRPAGEASSAEGATSTVVLAGTPGGKD